MVHLFRASGRLCTHYSGQPGQIRKMQGRRCRPRFRYNKGSLAGCRECNEDLSRRDFGVVWSVAQWFLQRMEGNIQTEVGPLRPRELLALVRKGEIKPATLLRKDDSAWFPRPRSGRALRSCGARGHAVLLSRDAINVFRSHPPLVPIACATWPKEKRERSCLSETRRRRPATEDAPTTRRRDNVASRTGSQRRSIGDSKRLLQNAVKDCIRSRRSDAASQKWVICVYGQVNCLCRFLPDRVFFHRIDSTSDRRNGQLVSFVKQRRFFHPVWVWERLAFVATKT